MPEPLHGEFYQAADELGIADAAGLPELRVHADLGEAGDGVDLVDVELARGCEEEIHPAHALAVEGLEGLYGKLLHALQGRGIELGGDLQTRTLVIQVFGL